jgi:uncharacterized membrane protein
MEPTATEPIPANPESDTPPPPVDLKRRAAAFPAISHISPLSRPHYVYPPERRIIASLTLTPTSRHSRFKAVLWISLGLTALFVFITSEVFLVTDYPMYHAYRLQVIADRHLLIPHTLCGVLALLAGPMQFSSRIRKRHLQFHRVLGRIYVMCVFIGALSGIALSAGRPGMPGTCVQAGAWVVCTTAALITARNRQIARHRQWMVRSYAVTFTFVSSRVLNLWPPYWSHLGDTLAAVGLVVFTLASLLVVEVGLNWHELAARRA